jgi:hypothetical protein
VADMMGTTKAVVDAACRDDQMLNAFQLGRRWFIPHQTVYDLLQRPPELRNLYDRMTKR